MPVSRLLLLTALLLAASAGVGTAAGSSPALGKSAPPFTLPDVQGKKRALAEFRGRRVALFFFCGCSWCADVAREWAGLQQGGALMDDAPSGKQPGSQPSGPEDPPRTVIVYSGLTAKQATGLAEDSGLDLEQTVLLLDPRAEITRGVYGAEPCPRVFVVDARGLVRYTNDSEEDAPRKAPALVLTARALDALRACGRAAPRANEPPRK